MTDKIDISAEAVEQMAQMADAWGEVCIAQKRDALSSDMARIAQTLRALAARLAEVEAERDASLGWRTVAESNQASAQSWIARAEAAEALLPEAVKAGMLYGAKVNPLVWGYHPCGAIAAPPTGHAYIIDTRMKGRVYSVKGFKPEREFGSLDEAKAAAQTDYEARIMAALEPAPAGVTVQEAARVLLDALDQQRDLRKMAWDATKDAPGDFGRWFAAALRALSEGST